VFVIAGAFRLYVVRDRKVIIGMMGASHLAGAVGAVFAAQCAY
jgi:hypothetical protein